MTPRRRYLEPSEGVRPEGAQPAPLACLVVLLAATAAGLARFGGPPDPSRLPGLPSWGTLEVLARSPNPSLEGVLQVTVLIAWLVWGWAAASVLVELALVLAETGPAQGAAWLGQARSIADRLTLPLARRAIAAAFVVQLATRPALPALAFVPEPAAAIVRPAIADTAGTFRSIARFEDLEPELAPRPGVIEHVVQKGDTLWSIAARYYGSGEEFDRVVDANIGTEMTDGRTFDRAGLIYPGWTLDIPLPSTVIEEHDGARWYVVQPGDTLCGIAARLLGGEARYTKLFQLNAGTRLGNDGPTLTSPDLIWPQLRLRLPGEAVAAPAESRQPDNASIELTPSSASERASPAGPPSAAAPERTPLPAPAGLPEVTPDESSATVFALPTPLPIDATADTALSADESTRSGGTMFTTPAQVAAGAALVALGAAATRALVRRRRRVAESDLEPVVALEQGFALADPARVLGHQLGGATDAPNEIANRLGRSYAAVLSSNLADDERAQVFGQVELVAVRHGQSSTTCVLSAPPAARAHLLRHLEPSVTAAFGDAVDIEGLVSHEGDVFIRLAGIDHRRLRLAVLDGPSAGESLWPSPLLVPLALLYDRQTLLANWHALSHVLVAGPLGQTAETVLVGLLASLVARRPPSDLALVTFASPNSLPVELTALPHQLVSPVDPANGAAVGAVLEQLRDELDRRGTADAQDGVDVVVVIRELAGLQDEYWELLGRLVSEGPRLRIHLLAASDQPAGELARSRSYLADFRTRLVLHTADEDASQALLGAAGAEELGPGGQLLIRLEGRTPVRAHGFRVAADHLARLVALMRQHAGAGFPLFQVPEPGEPAVPCADLAGLPIDDLGLTLHDADPGPGDNADSDGELQDADREHADCESAADDTAEGSATERVALEEGPAQIVAAPLEAVTERERPRSDLLRQLDHAPLRLRCFGTRGVWYGDRQVWPSAYAVEDTGWELVLLLGIHPTAGVQAETLADMIWDEETPADPGTVLRKRRRRLRLELKRLLPELDKDPLPTDPKGRVYRLDPTVVASDVHQFVELAAWAKSLQRADAIAAYEEALSLYQGDLLESVAVPTYPWLYDGASLATTLRPDYRRLHEEVRHRLADIYASGADDADLGRSVELYTELTGERPDEDQLWVSLLRVQGRRGDVLGLQASLRRLRTALVELGQGDDPDTVPLPPKVQRVLDEPLAQARASAESAADGSSSRAHRFGNTA